MWIATNLDICLVSMLLCPIFVDMLFCNSACHPFVKAIVEYYSVECRMPHILALFYGVCCYALYLYVYYCVSQNVTHLLKQL